MTSAARFKAPAEETAGAIAAEPSLAVGGGRTRVRLTEGLACEITDGAWRMTADLPAGAGGGGRGPDPGALIRGALGACLAMDIVTWAARLDVAVSAVAIEVATAIDARGNDGVDESVPAGYRAVTCRVTIESPEPEAAVRRVVETAEAHNPRLHDLTHRVPVNRELVVTRPSATTSEARSVNGSPPQGVEGVIVRPARPQDCADIARLFLIASDGLAEYIWSRIAPEGVPLLEVGRRRYARENEAFSYRNCLVAEEAGRVVAMLHGYAMPPREEAAGADDPDPVLQPYAELEDPGSLYIAGLAVDPEWRGRGLGRLLMARARERAEALGLPRISLICFERNEAALQLYRRLGFVEIDRRPLVPHPCLHYSKGYALLLVRGLD